MDQELFLNEYIEWRKTGRKNNEINSLIHLHFYFRNLKKTENKKYFDSFFKQDDTNIQDESVTTIDHYSHIEKEIDYDDCPGFGFADESLNEIDEYVPISQEENIENDLIISLVSEEESAFTQLYENEFFKIEHYVLGNSGSIADAQDLFQDGVLILLEKIKTPGFKLTCKTGTFLYSCCRNLWLKKLQKSSQLISSDYYEIYRYEQIEIYDEPEDLEKKLKILLSQLSENCIKIIEAFYYELKSWDIIAKDLGYNNAHSVKNQKYKCLQKILQ